jgi:RND family efflux transporter MFP subunit
MRRESLLLLALLILGCNRNQPAQPAANAPAAAAKKVEVVKPAKRAVKREVEQPGTVEPFEETVLRANITGLVGSVGEDPAKKDRPPHDRLFDIGSRVKTGQVLARIAVPELDCEFDQKQALVKQSEFEVIQAEKALAAAGEGVNAATAAVTEAEAGVDRTQALVERWQKEVARITKQVSGGVDTNQALDETQYQLKAAEASRKEAVGKVASAKAAVAKATADKDKAAADVNAVKAKLDVAKADAARVDALRGYTKIVAPYDAVITRRRSVNIGDRVSGTEGTALLTVAKIDPVRVVVNVPEADAGLVIIGQDVRLTLQGAGGAVPGKVTRTSWSLEPGSRTLRTEVDVANPEGKVRPGMYAYAKLTAELPEAWAVPAAAVTKLNDEPVMYLVEGGKAVRVAVQLGRGDAQFTQVRRYKKPGGDWADVTGQEAVASPAAGLTDGQPVP